MYVSDVRIRIHFTKACVYFERSGVIQEHTHWSNGLHQYLQIKHNLAMTPEGLTTSFMSNMAYFKRYGDNIYGMSGTLGSKSEQELLKRVYGVDIAFIPTFAEKRFTEVPAIITDCSKEQYQAIAASAHEITSNRRAALILAETIDDVENIKEALIQAGIESIKTYTTGSAEENEQVIKDRANSGDVIIATNLAGRGTDIKLSNLVKSTGGLHVILSFLPSNLRVEEQGYGRCARAGIAGSGQMILNATYESLKLHGANLQEHPRHLNEVDILKARRDLAEELRLQDIEKRLVPKIELKDEMFNRFKALSHELKRSEDNPYKQSQLEELWGLWFKQISNKLDNTKTGEINREEILAAQAEFIAKTRADYATGNIMQNPAYLNQEAVNLFGKWNQYDSSVEILHKADSVAGDYGYATSYNLAYCYFRQNAEHPKKNDERLINGAIEHLNKALSHLEGVIIPQLHMMQILVGNDQISTDLSLQIDAKLNLHKTQSEYIKNAFRKIEEGLGQGKVIVVNNKDTRPVFDIVGQTPSTASEEVLEIARQGIVQNYVLEARDPPKDVLSAIAVGVLGVSQFIVGALVTVASAVSATALGLSMMMSGAQDIYHGVRAAMGKEVVNWGDYWTNKGISYAVSIISMGWENFKAGLNAIKEQLGRLADAGRNFFAGTASSVMGKEAASEIAKGTIKESVSEASKTTFTSITSDFIAKKGMSQIVLEVGKNIATQNITKVVAKEISKQLEGEKEDIRENAYNQIMSTLNSEPVSSHISHLISLDKISRHNHYTGKIKQEAYRLLTPKANKISSLARKITSAAMSGVASRSGSAGAGIAVGTISTAAEIAEANKQIKNLVGDFCEDLRNSIVRIAQEANNTIPSVMYKLMPQYTVKAEEVNDIIDVLVANKVLDRDSMQFNHQFLRPMVNFEAGVVFNTPLPEPAVDNPIYHNEQIVNKPSKEKIQAFQIEEIKKNAPSEPKNIEEIDFGPFRRVRDRIIKVSREISTKQTEENQAEKQALAEELAGRAADRTVGIIRHNIIAPVAAPIVGMGVDKIAKGFMQAITGPERFMGATSELEERFLAENVARAGFTGIGVSAGDVTSLRSGSGNEKDKGSAATLEEDQDKHESLAANKERKDLVKRSRVMFDNTGGRGSKLLDEYIAQGVKAIFPRSTISQSYQISNNTDPVPLYDVSRRSETVNIGSRVGQEVDYSFAGRSSSSNSAEGFWSRIDFSPEQNSPTDRIAGTDFYGRSLPSPSFSVTRNNNSQSTFGYVVSELVGFPSAQAAAPIVLGTGLAAEGLAFSTAALGLGIGAAWTLNNAATGASAYQATSNYSREGSYQPALTGNLMIGGMNTGFFDNPVDQMRFDGTMSEVDEQTSRTNIVANKGGTMPVRDIETSVLLKGIDTSSDRPAITDFSAHYRPKSILSTPDKSAELAELSRLPGFAPSTLQELQERFPSDERERLVELSRLPGFAPSSIETLQESFPDPRKHIEEFDMSILERKIELDYDKLSKEYFDDDVRHIHDKKYEGAKITDLDPDLVERMSGLIITDKSGKVRGVHNTQDHHIIHQAADGAKELFDDLGLNIHGSENRITLPSDIKLTEHEITQMTQHVGKHSRETLVEIQDEVDDLSTSLREGNISKEEAKEKLLQTIQKHRQELETGKIDLNSVGRK